MSRSHPQQPIFSSGSEKILVRGVNWLGDAIMTTPALLRLREALPKAHITLLTPAKLAGLYQHHPAVDACLSFSSEEGLWQVARKLRSQQFDGSLIFPNSIRSALEVWLAGIPKRIGYAGQGRRFLLTHPIAPRQQSVRMHKRSPAEIQKLIASQAERPPTAPIPKEAHHIYQYLHLIRQMGWNAQPLAPRLDIPKSEVQEALQRFGIDPQAGPVLGLNPGAEYGPAKRWPAERFLAAALDLQKRTGCQWLIFGGKADIELGSHLASQLNAAGISHPARNLAGSTSLRELCVLLKACRVVVTNDTGPMHVAAAVGTPVVVLFGSTSPELTGPGMPGETKHQFLQAQVACAPCFLRECPIDFRCMHSLKPDQVVTAILRQLA